MGGHRAYGRPVTELRQGDVRWAQLAPVRGREQGGHRPVLVVAGAGYLRTVTTLVIAVPVTTTHRGWPNHVELTGLTGLDARSWAMTEQVRTIARDRLGRWAGSVDEHCLTDVQRWLSDFLALPLR